MSVYHSSGSADQTTAAKRAHSSTNIQGCFNDKKMNILKNKAIIKRIDSANTIFR